MKIGITTLLYHKRGLFKCLDDIARIGYEYVELNCVRGYYGHFNSIQLADSPELLEMIANSLKKNNLKCSGVDCHGLYQGPRFDMRYTEEYTEATMKVAKAIGAPMVITSYPNGDATWEERVNGTRRLAQMARAEGLGFAVEAEGGFAISNSTTVQKFIDEVGDGLVTVNFDPSHYMVAGEDPVEVLRKFRNVLGHVHFKEYTDGIHSAYYKGTPDSVADRVLRELASWPYNGVVSVETLADICDEPEAMSREIFAGMQKRLREF